MTLFLLFLLSSLFAGWLLRRQPVTWRLAFALAAAAGLAAVYFVLERFI
jgi:hypothetical protein